MAQFIPAAGPSNPEFASLQDGLAIVATGDTHAAITSGQYVYVKNHSTLLDGLYVATANIAANASLTTSNLTADSNGGLNALSDQIENIHGVNRTIYALTEEFTVPANGTVSVVTIPNAGLPNGAVIISMSMFTYNQPYTSTLIPLKTRWYSNSYITLINPTNNAITAPVGLEIEIFYYI